MRRAVNTPDADGQFALWQGGMEPNIPVGSADGCRGAAWSARSPAPSANSAKARAASGSRTGRWCTSSGPCGRRPAPTNQLGREFPRLRTRPRMPTSLIQLEPAPRTVRGARDLLSVAMQYGNAFGQGFQAAALKPADFFGNDDVLYLMEDMATGEIRLSILWEWLHKGATLTETIPRRASLRAIVFTGSLFASASRRGVREAPAARATAMFTTTRRSTTLPIAREIVESLRGLDGQAAVVHRSAERESRESRSGGRQTPHSDVRRCVRQRRTRDSEHRFRQSGEPSRRQLIREEADGDDVSSAPPRPHRRRHSAVANAGDARA